MYLPISIGSGSSPNVKTAAASGLFYQPDLILFFDHTDYCFDKQTEKQRMHHRDLVDYGFSQFERIFLGKNLMQ